MSQFEHDNYIRSQFPHLTEVWWDIIQERIRQDKKWGWLETPTSELPNGSDDRRLTIITEELGEVAKAINDRDFSGYVEELVQTAACIVAVLTAISATNQSDLKWFN